jgi:hypothetical protein
MLKKSLILAVVFIIGLVIFFNWFKKDTKKHSPAAVAEYTDGNLKIKIDYCKPYAKGRIIFGDEAAEALQPYGKYWRLGANEATTLELNQPIMFNEKKLAAGKYSIYAYPGENLWTICVNKEWDRWGAQEADAKNDVLRTEVSAINDASFQEQLEIDLVPIDSSQTVNLVIHWDKTEVIVPLKK